MSARSVIVSVGDELLAGRVVDSNAATLSAILRNEGFPVALRITAPDDVKAIASAVRRGLDEAHLVVVGGGIGPTKDDVTREGIACALGVPLVEHPDALTLVRQKYESRGIRVPEGSHVQALLPRGCEPVPNPTGTAPGILWREPGGDRAIVVLPGVPREFRAMIAEALVPLLRAHPRRGPAPTLASLTVAGMREVDVGRIIEDLMARGRDPVIGSYPKLGRIVLTIESTAQSGEEASRRVAADAAEIRRRLGAAVVGDGDLRLNEVVASLLLERGTTIAIAESVTGGLVADGLVEVAGASRVFLAGFVAYANRAKIDLLGVPESLLASQGAVSAACAQAMAHGARARTGADIGFATTGIAGPGGGSEEKPVGMVWFAVADGAGSAVARVVFPGDRAAIRAFTRERAFELLRRRLLAIPW